MRYVGYCRVSTEEQARNGAGLKAQALALRLWAEQQGVELTLLYERGCSGKRGAKRPKLDAVLKALDSREAFSGLVVAKLDRLSRSTIDFGLVLERARKRGWSVVLLDLGVDTSTPQGKAIAGNMVVMAELERDLIAQRTNEALAIRRSQGVHTGRRSTLADEIARRIVGDRQRGFSYASIAHSLNDDAVPTGQGAPRWSGETVRCVYLRVA